MAVTAFHAVNSGSNPLGDANRHQRLSFFLLLGRKGDMPRVPFLFKATENIPHTPGSFLSPFFVPKRIGCKALALRRHPHREARNA